MDSIDYKALFEAEKLQREEEGKKRKEAEERAEFEKLQREEAEKKQKEAEKRAELEKLQREEEEKKRKEAEKNVELEKLQREEEEKKRKEAEKNVEFEKSRADMEHQASHILAREDLKRPLPPYLKPLSTTSSTKGTKLIKGVPRHVTKWINFDQGLDTVYNRVGDKEIRRISDIASMENTELDKELSVQGFVQSVLLYMVNFFQFAQICEVKYIKFGDRDTPTNGGIPDIICKLKDHPLFVCELKRVTVNFQPPNGVAHPVDLYNSTSGERWAKNIKATLLQAHSYMLSKGNIKYGLITNYEQWCFFKRYLIEDDEAIEISKCYFSSENTASVRLALAHFMLITLEDEIKVSKPGKMDELIDKESVVEEEEEEEGPTTATTSTMSTTTSTTTTGTKKKVNGTRKQVDFFSVGTIVDGFEFVATKHVLNIESLSVHAPESIIISSSEKATTFHGHIGDAHLVWRQIDIYGLPKHNSDFPLDVLQEMVTQEIQAYHHLRPYWGTLVPQFIYFGQDFNMLWVFVTSYEGVSLRELAKGKGGLEIEIKEKVRTKLIALHKQGVIHGDAVLRNALYRETDGEVIWVDLEFAVVFQTLDVSFTQLARAELEAFDKELASVPDLEISSPTELKCKELSTDKKGSSTKSKRSKVLAA